MKKIFIFIICLLLPVTLHGETIILKSGQKIEGKIIERTDEKVKVDIYGIPITYYYENIESIDGQKIVKTVENELSSEVFDFIKLPETISNINVDGKTACQIQLIKDALQNIIPMFKARTNEDISAFHFQYISMKQDKDVLIWQEIWTAKSKSFECQYKLFFEFAQGYGTDIRITELDKPQKRNFNDATIESKRSEAYHLLEQRRYSLALSKFKQIVELLPEDPKSHMDYGSVLFASASQYFERDREPMFEDIAIPILQESAIHLKKATQLFDNDKESKFFKAHAYYLLGDIYHYGLVNLDQAEGMYKRALDVNPENKMAHDELEHLRTSKSKKNFGN